MPEPFAQRLAKVGYTPTGDDEPVDVRYPDGTWHRAYVQMIGPNGDIAVAAEVAGEAEWLFDASNVRRVDVSKARSLVAKIGRVLSSANEKTLRQAVDSIERVLVQLGIAETDDAQPLSKAEVQSGVMVALYPSAELAQKLAQPGGEPVEELHLTLAFLGDMAYLGVDDAGQVETISRLRTIVAAFAATCPPLEGTISGTGTFSNDPPATYASVDCPCLSEVRQELCEMLCAAGLSPSTLHGFTPHITLAYDRRPLSLPLIPASFSMVALAVGGGTRYYWPLTGAPHCHDDDAPVAVTMGEQRKAAEWNVPVWKDDAAQVVYGVVLQPGVTDSQGDRVSAAEIEQAAHRYLVESRKSDVQHDEREAPVNVVESYIAPMDMVVADRKVIKGAWVMGVHVADPALWQKVVKQEITGFSIGGSAIRT